jgi:drug/metabolite transporter (DMT)-like permease
MRARVWIAFLAIYIIWGSTYLAIRIAIETIPPLLLAGARYLISGLLLFGWLRLRGECKTTWREWREASIVGGLMLLGGNGAVSWAEQFVPSGLAALLVSTIPICHPARLALAPKRSPEPERIFLGLWLGIIGVSLLVRPGAAPSAQGGVSISRRRPAPGAGSRAAGGLYAQRAKLPASSLRRRRPWR